MPQVKVVILKATPDLPPAFAAHQLDGLAPVVIPHHDGASVLPGADFVICADIHDPDRLDIDRQIILKHYPTHPVSPSAGVAGISRSLRTIAFIQQLAADMKRLCPNAWLLNLAEPVSRICHAAHEEGIRTAGVCAQSLLAYARAWKILHGEELADPFEPARSQLNLTTAGLGHMTWMVKLRGVGSKDDLYPTLRARVKEDPSLAGPLSAYMLRQTGHLPACADDRLQPFLDPQGPLPPRPPQSQLDAIEREAWKSALDIVAAMAHGRPAEFAALTLLNTGQIVALPRNVFVETPAIAGPIPPTPSRVDLPQPVLPLCRDAALLNDVIVRAARGRSLRYLRGAITMEPTIIDKNAGWRAIEDCLVGHAHLLGTYH